MAFKPAQFHPGAMSRPLVIDVINSMPGTAGRYTERQYRTILNAAAKKQTLEIRFLSLDATLYRHAEPNAARSFCDCEPALPGALPDGVIVTGMPPRATALADEPEWHKLVALIEFTVSNAIPAIWSCLAAHAAVLHMDGIERRRLPEKLSGLIECTRVEYDHPIARGLPLRWQVPHSRYNDLPEHALLTRGYRVVSRSPEAGADIFAKTFTSLFLFCQGHPEYSADTLLREYRRDIRQFLCGERDAYPHYPRRYFSSDVESLLAVFHNRALKKRTPDCLVDFPLAECIAELRHSWRDFALALYGNWLTYVVDQASGRHGGRH